MSYIYISYIILYILYIKWSLNILYILYVIYICHNFFLLYSYILQFSFKYIDVFNKKKIYFLQKRKKGMKKIILKKWIEYIIII